MKRSMIARAGRLLTSLRERAQAAGALPDEPKRDWYKITALSEGGEADLYIYDMIGDWGISASALAEEMAGVRASLVNVRVNSQGGDAWDGIAIHTTLRRHPARCVGYVDGVAASAASVILMACDDVVMEPGSRIMIHDASTMAYGNAAELTEVAEILDGVSYDMASLYARKAGGTPEQWRERMRGEGKRDGTWYSAEEAVAVKLADRVAGEDSPEAPDGDDPAERDVDPMDGWAGIVPAAEVVPMTASAEEMAEGDEPDYAEIGSSILAALALKGAM